MNNIRLLVAGEYGMVVEFGNSITPEINALVQQLTRLLAARSIPGILEIVPTYRSATIYFDPLLISRQELTQLVMALVDEIEPQQLENIPQTVVHIPVCYGGVLGPDLEFVARYTGLTTEEVIALHTAKPYLVYMLGFTPGFPYLGGLAEKLVVPRQEKPRAKVPAGSVGIGGNQTGIYSIESPGEWWLIGRTPLKAFNPQNTDPFLLAAGNYVKFSHITIDEYFDIRRQVEAGNYRTKIHCCITEGESP